MLKRAIGDPGLELEYVSFQGYWTRCKHFQSLVGVKF